MFTYGETDKPLTQHRMKKGSPATTVAVIVPSWKGPEPLRGASYAPLAEGRLISSHLSMNLTASAVSEVCDRPPFSIRKGVFPVGCGLDLDAITDVLIADEVEVVVVCGMGNLESFDDQPGDFLK